MIFYGIGLRDRRAEHWTEAMKDVASEVLLAVAKQPAAGLTKQQAAERTKLFYNKTVTTKRCTTLVYNCLFPTTPPRCEETGLTLHLTGLAPLYRFWHFSLILRNALWMLISWGAGYYCRC